MAFDVKVRDRVLRPIGEVFAVWVEQDGLSPFFVASASGPMIAGTEVLWRFEDVGAEVTVHVETVDPGKLIVFSWSAAGAPHRVSVSFEEGDDDSTVVRISEGPFELDPDDVGRALGQNAGWTQMLACLKAWLQFRVNLRAGLDKRLTDMS